MPFEKPKTVDIGDVQPRATADEAAAQEVYSTLKDASYNRFFCLKRELQADSSKGIPRRYKRRLVSGYTVGNHRLYPEGTVPVVSDDGKPFLFPEDTEIVFPRD